jgi:DNA-binding NtrC family response regulator
MNNNLSILIVDDEQYILDELSESLTDRSFIVQTADRPSKAFNILKKDEIDIVILDINLPEMDGLQVLKKMKQDFSGIEVIMITAQSEINYVLTAMREGAADFFLKPFLITDVLLAIQKTERYKKLNQKLNQTILTNQALTKEIRENTKIVGNSQAIVQVFSLMNDVSKYPETNVLVTGESGTGKELVARGIHNLSSKQIEICFAVNCAAIPEHLFESELFGHEKGAFTGAVNSKIGCFELTRKGTLILDEITEMPLNLQAKLLRVLEERTVARIGSHHQIKLDSRIIATSNRNVMKLIEENKFREDLYHRLNTFQIEIPPLRDRTGDIALLIDFMNKTISYKLKKHPVQIDKSVYELLDNYSFPGNVRELKNILERALILCKMDILIENDFSFMNQNSPKNSSEFQDFDLQSNEKKVILLALERCSGNRLKAAKLLNITWQTLDRRLKKHKIVIESNSTIQ